MRVCADVKSRRGAADPSQLRPLPSLDYSQDPSGRHRLSCQSQLIWLLLSMHAARNLTYLLQSQADERRQSHVVVQPDRLN